MKEQTQQTYRQRILRVMQHIHEHLDRDMALDQLAKIAFFSPYHFHRIFSAMTGQSVHQYIRRLRLEAAALKLKQTNSPVTQIALGAGYQRHESFTRAFRAQFGVSPSQFRDNGKPFRPATPAVILQETKLMSAELAETQVRIEHREPLRIAYVRKLGPYEEAGKAFEKLAALAGPRGMFGPDMQVVGVSHDDPDVTPSEKIRYDAGMSVADDFEPDGELQVQVLCGGEYAVLRYKGHYGGLGQAFKWFYGIWLPSSEREPADAPPFEVYLNNCKQVPPEHLLTDLCMPFKPL